MKTLTLTLCPGDAKRQASQTKAAEGKGYDMGRSETLDSLRRSGKI